jgi:hypothetical protein
VAAFRAFCVPALSAGKAGVSGLLPLSLVFRGSELSAPTEKTGPRLLPLGGFLADSTCALTDAHWAIAGELPSSRLALPHLYGIADAKRRL